MICLSRMFPVFAIIIMFAKITDWQLIRELELFCTTLQYSYSTSVPTEYFKTKFRKLNVQLSSENPKIKFVMYKIEVSFIIAYKLKADHPLFDWLINCVNLNHF